ncbi:major facilitator superfamily domain-containing protein [Lipomyces starkeyi]
MTTVREHCDPLIDHEAARLLSDNDDLNEDIVVEGARDDSPDIDADGPADSEVGQEVDVLSTRALVAIFFSLYIGRFLHALDGTVIVTLLARISSEFHESRLVSWIASSYLIALAAFQPLFGKISDTYGRKQLLLFSNSVFAVGCILCGFSSNVWFLVFARIIAGIGGSGLNALSVIALSDLVPLRQRGLIHGIGCIIYNLGAALGGVIGGVITKLIAVRWYLGPGLVDKRCLSTINLQFISMLV